MTRNSKPVLYATAATLALAFASACSSEKPSDEKASVANEQTASETKDHDAEMPHETTMSSDAREGVAKPNEFWWPETLDLSPLRRNDDLSDPMGD